MPLPLAHSSLDSIGGYSLNEFLGQGAFASVYLGKHLVSGSVVAIKVIQRKKLNRKLLRNLEVEIAIPKQGQHPHIVHLIDSQSTADHVVLFMEYCSLGDMSILFPERKDLEYNSEIANMFERFPSPANALNPNLVRHFLKQLASALKFLRERRLVHRDIKPQNLLLCPAKHSEQEFKEAGFEGCWNLPVLKLADFGFARYLPSTSLTETVCGSPHYMAPEIQRHEKYDAKADLWSVGSLSYEMLTGQHPFEASTQIELAAVIEKTNDKITFPSNIFISNDFRRLILSLLKKNPTKRIGFADFFNNSIIVDDITVTQNIPPKVKPSLLNKHSRISKYQQAKPSASSSPPIPHHEFPDAVLFTKPSFHSSLMQSTIQPRSIPPSRLSLPTKERKQRKPKYVLESDYVMVEKRTVEINSMADDFAKHRPSPTQKTNVHTARNPNHVQRRNSVRQGSSPTITLTRVLNKVSAIMFSHGKISTVPPRPAVIPKSFVPPLPSEDEQHLVKAIQHLATQANVISLFANVKYSQLMPSDSGEILSPANLVVVSQEANVLYVKALSLLSKAMDRAAKWWDENDTAPASTDLTRTVEEIRAMFNAFLERAEYAQSHLRSYASTAAKLEVHATTSHKLIFDRATEISGNAAKSELIWTDPYDCQLSYCTAIVMLETLLVRDAQELSLPALGREDTAIVINFMKMLRRRLKIVQNKTTPK